LIAISLTKNASTDLGRFLLRNVAAR